jgi:NAD(P)H-flavin reductase
MSEVFVEYLGRRHRVQPGETVLKALQKAGEKVESSCEAGVCQSCVIQATEGPVPAAAQAGLKPSLKSQGCFLACLCKPVESLVLAPAADAAGFRGQAEIESVEEIGPEIVRARFRRPEGLDYRAGQFLMFTRPDGEVSRSYSIASLPSEAGSFEIHVRRVQGGRMSEWFFREARAGDKVSVSGPRGDCYYDLDVNEPITLVGTGTGMAPLRAIVLDALEKGHEGAIRVYDGAVEASRLYLRADFERIVARHPNVSYFPCVLRGDRDSPGAPWVGDLSVRVLESARQAREGSFYLCGDPLLVKTLKKGLFLGGVPLARILADPFVEAARA